MAQLTGGVHELSGAAGACVAAAALVARHGPLVLASASPRRAELLGTAGLDFEVLHADVDESPRPGETPGAAARRLSEDKARAVARRRPDALVLAGDTLVARDDVLLGKPSGADEARAMLASLAGRTHEVLSGAALCHGPSGRLASGVHVATVALLPLDAATLDAYLRDGEWRDKAGAYAIQGAAGAFATLRDGRLDTVIGLSLALVEELSRRLDAELSAPEQAP